MRRSTRPILNGSEERVRPDFETPSFPRRPDPVDVSVYGSCAALCEAKTGSSTHAYYGASYSWLWGYDDDCWNYGHGGNCDYNCATGYCRAAPFDFADHPSDVACTEQHFVAYEGWFMDIPILTGGQSTWICCCDKFYTVDGAEVEVVTSGG